MRVKDKIFRYVLMLTPLFLAACVLSSAMPEDVVITPDTQSHPVESPETTTPASGCDLYEDCGDSSMREETDDIAAEYESLNGTTNRSGKEYRSVHIDSDNPFKKTTLSETIRAIDERETFWLYIGDTKCPWCRAVIESALAEAKENGINEIRYMNIWDAEGNEILRDKYELKNGEPVLVQEGADGYSKLLERFDAILPDYTLEDDDETKIGVGEKRIYAPSFFRIVDGAVQEMVTGIPDSLNDPRDALTSNQIDQERSIFRAFFNSK